MKIWFILIHKTNGDGDANLNKDANLAGDAWALGVLTVEKLCSHQFTLHKYLIGNHLVGNHYPIHFATACPFLLQTQGIE